MPANGRWDLIRRLKVKQECKVSLFVTHRRQGLLQRSSREGKWRNNATYSYAG